MSRELCGRTLVFGDREQIMALKRLRDVSDALSQLGFDTEGIHTRTGEQSTVFDLPSFGVMSVGEKR